MTDSMFLAEKDVAESLQKVITDSAHVVIFVEYLKLLTKWNRACNLTAVREPHEMVTRHVLDSLSIAPLLEGPYTLDVGSGAGFPGIPLAVTNPHLEFVLLDSCDKKTRFLLHVVQMLNIKNVQVVNARVESFRSSRQFDNIVSRAFASLAKMLERTKHLCKSDGQFLAMKGAYPVAELAEVTDEFIIGEVRNLQVPGLNEQRHLVCIKPARV